MIGSGDHGDARDRILDCLRLSKAGAGKGGIARDLSIINWVPRASTSSWLFHHWHGRYASALPAGSQV